MQLLIEEIVVYGLGTVAIVGSVIMLFKINRMIAAKRHEEITQR